MNNEKKGSRKDWVKNVAIIFLTILLLLTFFSNTIMNYSLPEVATTMVEPGSITAKIRGTGTLTSEDPYKITIQESRTIASVAVKAGDVVEKDQVLFYLEDKESTELETAEKELNELLVAYSTTILKGEISNESYHNIQSGNISSENAYQERINAARMKVENAQSTVNSLERQVAIAATTTGENSDKSGQLEAAKAELERANSEAAQLEARLGTAQSQTGGDAVALTEEKHKADEVLKEKITAFQGSDGTGGIRKETEDAMNTILAALTPAETVSVKNYDTIKNINSYMGVLSELYEKAKKANEPSDPVIEANLQTALEKMEAFRKAFEEYVAAKTNLNAASSALNKVVNAKSQIGSLQKAVTDAKNYVNECQARVSALENEISNNQANVEKHKSDLALQKLQAETDLKTAQEELTQLLTDVSNELNLGNQNSIIRKKREEIAKLKEKAVGTTIKAPVAGIVTGVHKTAGETTQPDEELAVMQPEGKGYSMSFSVTAEQAKKVSVGEAAEIQNSWFYSDIQATLTGIRPDPENPSQKKLLVFDVSGDVQAGQSVSLSIGQKSTEYDLLVPNSAVREDNQGKFILIVESKSSPLGNRYMARRVDVEVLGADDLKTAISGALYGYEYVITTSTQPVEAEKQVRLADSD